MGPTPLRHTGSHRVTQADTGANALRVGVWGGQTSTLGFPACASEAAHKLTTLPDLGKLCVECQ